MVQLLVSLLFFLNSLDYPSLLLEQNQAISLTIVNWKSSPPASLSSQLDCKSSPDQDCHPFLGSPEAGDALSGPYWDTYEVCRNSQWLISKETPRKLVWVYSKKSRTCKPPLWKRSWSQLSKSCLLAMEGKNKGLVHETEGNWSQGIKSLGRVFLVIM